MKPFRSITLPLYQKLSAILLGLSLAVFILWVTRPIIVPLLFALLLALLLNPISSFLIRKKVPKLLSIGLVVLLAVAVIAAIGYFIVTQAAHLSETLPQLEEKLTEFGKQAQRWAQDAFGMRNSEVKDAVEKIKDSGMEKGGSAVGTTLATVGTVFAFFFLLPVFTFLLLMYKGLLITFIGKLFSADDQGTVKEVFSETKTVVQSYLVGLLIEAAIVATLNWVGLIAIGLKYALLMAVLGALLNLIPYVGMMIATVVPMALAVATQEPVMALWVLALYLGVQFVDNNILVPRIVGSRVQLNALVSIIGVMAGGLLWGIPGMFLSLPMLAILKVIFDRVPSLEPFGYLLGDENGHK